LQISSSLAAKTEVVKGAVIITDTEFKKGVYFDGSNTTNGMLDVLEEERPKIICIDELDKMPREFQNQLLNFMESGRQGRPAAQTMRFRDKRI
jgi:MoxR-like ATPase